MAQTPHGTKGWIKYMEGAREFFEENGTLNGYKFYKWKGQRWYPDNKSRVIPNKNFNPNRRIGNNLYSPKSYESKLKEISDRRSWHLDGRFTEKDYLDYAKKHNYPEAKAKSLYKQMQKDLKKDKDLISKYMHDDHINAISLDEGFEHPRNKVILDAETNLKKSAMRLDDATQEAIGTYKTKEGFLKADFEGVPMKGNLEKQRIVTKAVNQKVLENAQAIGQRSAKSRVFKHINYSKAAGTLGGLDSLARIATGDVVGGTLGLAMQSKPFHDNIGKILSKRLAKSGAKLLPGVGMSMGTLEAAGYAAQGRLTQSGIAAFSALIGEIPGIGDVLSMGADLLNTGIDIATGNAQVQMDNAPPDVRRNHGLTRAVKGIRY